MSDNITINTESDAFQAILDWSKDKANWQRDCLRRLIVDGDLSKSDHDELLALCKDETKPCIPLDDTHIGGHSAGVPTVTLKSIKDAQNINALAEGQTLPFNPNGLSVVYGNNGSGKSGYVRILKRACRARTPKGKTEVLLHNIYSDGSGKQTAEIEYVAGGQNQKVKWEVGVAADALLSEVSVFDTKTANVHVEETNNLAYTPRPMKVVEELVSASRELKERFDAEHQSLKDQTPQAISSPTCSDGSQVGKLLSKLSGATNPEEVIALAKLSDGEEKQLKTLEGDFAQGADVIAKRLRSYKAGLAELLVKLRNLSNAVSDESASGLASLTANAKAKSDAAKLASSELFDGEPLKGVGSESWKALWETARAFSELEAYQARPFPVVDGDAHCLLCQQKLQGAAPERLKRFEVFVQDQTQTQARDASNMRDTTLSELARTAPTQSQLLKRIRQISDEIELDALAAVVRTFVAKAKWRLRDMMRLRGDSGIAIPPLPEAELTNAIEELEKRAAAILAEEDSEERKAQRAQYCELKDRKWLSTILDDVIAEIGRRKAIAELEVAVKSTRPNAITALNTQLSKALITERLRARFAQEIDDFKLAGLAIELKQAKSQLGVSRFRIGLMEAGSQNAGEILSEGEYRCVALAGFLAELATSDSDSGIIFDDPVSSLDHLHRQAIAERLAKEGKKRQVIVFTHDIAFLFLLRRACLNVDNPAEKSEIVFRHIQKRGKEPGHCRNEAPDSAKPTGKRLSTVRAHLANTKVKYDQDPDGDDWLMTSRGLINSVRQIWEKAIEDAISPVLRTFQSQVNTKGFKKLSAIELADAITMKECYGHCSVLLHQASDELNPQAPTPQQIEDEIKALENWIDDLETRQKAI
ncbi:AAA family ATPase [Parasphingorhabdus cellanae]|uniref:AAA family ATPase n=1 Tax=Parasphingorhabdus cellanae TaxID=2806553 RepID=A0ABX7T903_9SPHN|nr:AAA family ATPase [Parasphingorhabdus cellanae]QTD57262.1 AAA family ATPase [Parasphingorhabdus cellanae]